MKSNYDQYKKYLTKEEEAELYVRMKDGDDEAREELILSHSYMVITLANQYSKYGPYEDLEQEGMLALVKAVDKYDFAKGRLRTYAYRAIKLHVLRFLDRNRHIIKLPEPQIYELLNLLKIRDRLHIELRREPTHNDLITSPEVIEAHKLYSKKQKLKYTLKEYVNLLSLGEPVNSLNEPITDDFSLELADIVEDPRQQSEYERVETEDIGNVIMDILDEREKYVLKSIAGGWTGQEIGNKLGITTQSISQIKQKAIKKIKQHVKDNPELMETIKDSGFIV